MTNVPTYHRGDRNFGAGFDMMERIEELEARLAEIERYATAGGRNGFDDCPMCENTLNTLKEMTGVKDE